MTDVPSLDPVGVASSSAASSAKPRRSVHLLMVHGVGRHDPLSSLLHVYQSFRANLRSPEAPVLFEDRIPEWRLDAVSEDTAPPYLKLVPRFPVGEDDAAEVYLYEVNYSMLAGLVRRNHPLDLTTLFVGFALPDTVRGLRAGRDVAGGVERARFGRDYFPTVKGTVAVVVSHTIASVPLFCVTSAKKIVN